MLREVFVLFSLKAEHFCKHNVLMYLSEAAAAEGDVSVISGVAANAKVPTAPTVAPASGVSGPVII